VTRRGTAEEKKRHSREPDFEHASSTGAVYQRVESKSLAAQLFPAESDERGTEQSESRENLCSYDMWANEFFMTRGSPRSSV
jgi:hypothetical protein